MIDAEQLRRYVVAPALRALSMDSEAAQNLLLGTAAVESRLGTYVHQVGGGPALGIWQMEPVTHADIWRNYLRHRKPLADGVLMLVPPLFRDLDPEVPVDADALIASPMYAAAMARLHYRRYPEPLPAANDWAGMAALWKLRYNGPGKGTPQKFMEAIAECRVVRQ